MIAFLLQLCGCSIDTDSKKDDNEKAVVSNVEESNQNEKLIIYDKQQVLGEIYHFGIIIQIDNGIIYSK